MCRWMTALSGALFLWVSSLAAAQQTPSGIPLDAPWKMVVYEFATSKLEHSAWGFQHSERDYQLALLLAESEGLLIDRDVLFAAAFLHDLGAFEPFAVAGAEHSQVAAETVASILEPTGFPMEKIGSVQTAILAHMYYAAVPEDATARVLHDADTLNFLGALGVTRIISLTTRENWAADLPTAVATLENFSQQLPPTLQTESARRIAQGRVREMQAFLQALKLQTLEGRAL
jgi:uncharacterized protein